MQFSGAVARVQINGATRIAQFSHIPRSTSVLIKSTDPKEGPLLRAALRARQRNISVISSMLVSGTAAEIAARQIEDGTGFRVAASERREVGALNPLKTFMQLGDAHRAAFPARARTHKSRLFGNRGLPLNTCADCAEVQAIFRRRRHQPRRPPLAQVLRRVLINRDCSAIAATN